MQNRLKNIKLIAIGFTLGFILVAVILSFILFGNSILSIKYFIVVLGTVTILLCITILLLKINKERIISKLTETASTKKEEVSTNVSNLIKGVSQKNENLVKESANQIGSSVMSIILWREVRGLLLGITFTLFGAFITILGSAVLIQQNQLIELQNKYFKKSNQPNYSVELYNEVRDSACYNRYKIINSGYHSYNEKMHVLSFIKTTIWENGNYHFKMTPLKGRFIGIDDFNMSSTFRKECESQIERELTSHFYHYVRKLDNSNYKTDESYLSVISYLVIDYETIFDEYIVEAFILEQTNYKRSGSLDGIRKIDSEMAKLLLNIINFRSFEAEEIDIDLTEFDENIFEKSIDKLISSEAILNSDFRLKEQENIKNEFSKLAME